MKKQIHIDKHVAVGLCVLVAVTILALYGYRCVSTEVCGSSSVERAIRSTVTMTMPQGLIQAEVAATPAAREQGLSGRTSLATSEGMLFIFPLPGRYGFWMKDMVIPLDIMWINQNGVVVKVVENAKPEDYPETYINDAQAMYVLEIGAGEARAHGVYLGSKVMIEGE